ncbi:MAG TPA: FAD-dependent oxidoreductase [Candidatus Goldiibacteriota bacterium]|nr:FAD-dependent oxidoreductase [Candidatus Goldiibacteriota bacterium]
MMKTIIIGAGFAGLSAASALINDFIIIEKESRPGGLCRSEEKDGFVFDYTGHFLHLRTKKASDFVREKCGVLPQITRKAFVFSGGVYTGYPYQANYYGLPSRIALENLEGFLKAREKGKTAQDNFKDWILTALGEGNAKNFMFPYNKKLFKYPLEKLTLDWMGRFVPSPSVEEVMKGLLPEKDRGMGYNASFYYPKKCGIESVIKSLYMGLEKKTLTGEKAVKIELKKKAVHCDSGRVFKYENIISTMPLPELAAITGRPDLIKAASRLKAVSVYCLNVGFKKQGHIGRHWVYVPEKKYPFYRIGFPSEVSVSCAPAGCSSVFAEVSFKGRVPRGIDERIVSGLADMGIIKKRSDIICMLPMILKNAYVIYDREREGAVSYMEKELLKAGILLAGRWGKWEYSSMEDAIIEGMAAAEKIVAGK